MLTDWEQSARTHRGDSLLNSIVTTCLQACNSLRVFTCVPPLLDGTERIYVNFIIIIYYQSMCYHVTTKSGQSKYTAGSSRGGSILKTKFLTGEQKWTFARAMFRVRNINEAGAYARFPLRC